MKAVNLRKYDISCLCINGSKITALCGIGNRIHRVELKNKNISGLNQKGFVFFFVLQLIYHHFIWSEYHPKNTTHSKNT